MYRMSEINTHDWKIIMLQIPYFTEACAVQYAARMISNNYHQVVIFTDALYVLQALKGGKLPALRKELSY
jgi:hypothetical protein